MFEYVCLCRSCDYRWEVVSSYAPCLCPECQEDVVEVLGQYSYD